MSLSLTLQLTKVSYLPPPKDQVVLLYNSAWPVRCILGRRESSHAWIDVATGENLAARGWAAPTHWAGGPHLENAQA